MRHALAGPVGAGGGSGGSGGSGWLGQSAVKTQRLADRLEARRPQEETTTTKKKKKKKKKKPPPYSTYTRRAGRQHFNRFINEPSSRKEGGGGGSGGGYQDMFERARGGAARPPLAADTERERDELKHPPPTRMMRPSPLLSPSSSPPATAAMATTSLAAIVAAENDGADGADGADGGGGPNALAQLGALFQCAWEGVVAHETGMPRPAPRLLLGSGGGGAASGGPLLYEQLSFLQGKISSTLLDCGATGSGGDAADPLPGGADDVRDSMATAIRGQSLGRSRVARYLMAADKNASSSSIDWEDVRAIQAERQRTTTESQRRRIAGIRNERKIVYRRLLDFYRHRMKVEGFRVGDKAEEGESDGEEAARRRRSSSSSSGEEEGGSERGEEEEG
jgi:hypothetical protein